MAYPPKRAAITAVQEALEARRVAALIGERKLEKLVDRDLGVAGGADGGHGRAGS